MIHGSYYPLLQELSFIRPLRFMSPTMFVGGLGSDALTQNSCPTGWGVIEGEGARLPTRQQDAKYWKHFDWLLRESKQRTTKARLKEAPG